MKLANAVRHYNTEVVNDGYSGDFLWLGRFKSFDDHASSGATSRRRMLHLNPEAIIPDRMVVEIMGEYWIVGDGNTDGFKNRVLNRAVNLKKSTGIYHILSPHEACSGLAGVQAHGHQEYFKDTVDTVNSGTYYPFWNVFFSQTESITRGKFLRLNNTLFRIRSAYLTGDKYMLGECDELSAGAFKSITFQTNGTLDVLSDTITSDTTVTTGILLEFPKLYNLQDRAQELQKQGDYTLLLPSAPTVGSTFLMDSATWTVVAIAPELDAWNCHVRLA